MGWDNVIIATLSLILGMLLGFSYKNDPKEKEGKAMQGKWTAEEKFREWAAFSDSWRSGEVECFGHDARELLAELDRLREVLGQTKRMIESPNYDEGVCCSIMRRRLGSGIVAILGEEKAR